MSINPRLPFTIHTNVPVLAERHPGGGQDGVPLFMRRIRGQQEHQVYQHRAMMLPSVYQRFINYRRRQGYRMRSAASVFEVSDMLEVLFRPRVEEMVGSAQQMAEAIQTILNEEYQIPGDLPGTVIYEVIFDNAEEVTTLDGESIIEQSLASLEEFNGTFIEEALQVLNERGYTEISLVNFQVTFQFPVIDLLNRLAGGACPGVYDTTFPTWEKPLCDYDHYSHGEKGKLGKMIMGAVPSHLKGLRGLWWMDDSRSERNWIEPVCGLMAYEYGKEMAKHFRGEPNYCADYYAHPDLLYSRALELQMLVPCPITNATLRSLILQDAPDHAIYVYDYCMLPMYHFEGPDYVMKRNAGYEVGELTHSEWVQHNAFRINVFLDQEKSHYLPIFNFRLFFNPLKVPKRPRQLFEQEEGEEEEEQDDGLEEQGPEDEEEEVRVDERRERMEEERLVSCLNDGYRQSEVRLPCPYCHHRLSDKRMRTHRCSRLDCRYCGYIFSSYEDRLRHYKPKEANKSWTCDGCRERIPNYGCYVAHRQLCTGECFDKCVYCRRNFKISEPHQCPRIKCGRCSQIVRDVEAFDEDNDFTPYRQLHACPLRPKKKQRLQSSSAPAVTDVEQVEPLADTYWAFDFECMLAADEEGHFQSIGGREIKVYHHIVNYAVAYKLCRDGEETERPNEIESRTLPDFWNKILQMSLYRSTVWYAHNLKGYDGRLLMDFFELEGIVPTSVLLRGKKIMSMTLRHPTAPTRITFKDSLCHIAAPLANFPAMFGLENVEAKGFFPYLFNTPANQSYRGRIPSRDMFEQHFMTSKKRAEFVQWYRRKQKSRVYDLQRELIKYCRNDTLILKEGLLAYADVCMKYGKRNPLQDMTIAQFTFNVYRERHMPPDTLFHLDSSHIHFARRSLHGGKTDARKFVYHQTEEDKLKGAGLRYIDIQSLYPTVQYYDSMPTGRPRTTRYDEDHPPSAEVLREVFGFIECDIEPTRYLHHPLLCAYQNNRLMAHLKPMKRVVLTSVEFHTAVQEAGYRCTRVYRIDQYEPCNTLFQSFVREWLTLKTVSSQCPVAETEFQDYKTTMMERFGIEIAYDDFSKNPSLRTLAKMVLNSLWGKFGQRDDLSRSAILHTSAARVKYYARKRKGLLRETQTGVFGGRYPMKKYVPLFRMSDKNMAVASFVTAHARLRLWRELHRLGDRVYYHDTDSIIYYDDPSNPYMYRVPEGIYLGEWESETGSAMVTDYAAIAPKTYAFRFVDPKTGQVVNRVKAKGFNTAGAHAESIFTLENYEKLLSGDVEELTIGQRIFRHDRYTMQTYDSLKKMVFKYAKGMVDRRTWSTYPFGSERFIDMSGMDLLGASSLASSLSSVDEEEQAEVEEMVHQEHSLFQDADDDQYEAAMALMEKVDAVLAYH